MSTYDKSNCVLRSKFRNEEIRAVPYTENERNRIYAENLSAYGNKLNELAVAIDKLQQKDGQEVGDDNISDLKLAIVTPSRQDQVKELLMALWDKHQEYYEWLEKIHYMVAPFVETFDSLANGFENTISGIVLVDEGDMMSSFDDDPCGHFVDTLEEKLISDGMLDDTHSELAGVTEDGQYILYYVAGIDSETQENMEEEATPHE